MSKIVLDLLKYFINTTFTYLANTLEVVLVCLSIDLQGLIKCLRSFLKAKINIFYFINL